MTTASLRPKQRGDAALQIVQRVAVLGEDDQLLAMVRALACGIAPTPYGAGFPSRRLAIAAGVKISPAGWPAPAICYLSPLRRTPERKRFQALQSFDFRPQLGDGACGGGLIEDFLLGGFDFVVGRFFQILDVFSVECRDRCGKDGATSPPRWSTSSSRSRLSSRSRRRRRDW